MGNNTKAIWPDLTVDQRSWELAKIAVGTSNFSKTAARAQEIKQAMLNEDEMERERRTR